MRSEEQTQRSPPPPPLASPSASSQDVGQLSETFCGRKQHFPEEPSPAKGHFEAELLQTELSDSEGSQTTCCFLTYFPNSLLVLFFFVLFFSLFKPQHRSECFRLSLEPPLIDRQQLLGMQIEH